MSVCVCVCVCVRERERESVCVCVCERERERERVSVCVCVFYGDVCVRGPNSFLFSHDMSIAFDDQIICALSNNNFSLQDSQGKTAPST